MRVTAIDFETSDYARSSACAVGLVHIDDDVITDSWVSLIRPPLTKVLFTNVHGLLWEDLKDQLSFDELWPELNDQLQSTDLFIAHNASFDKSVLHKTCGHYDIAFPPAPFHCTVKLARRTWALQNNKLKTVCEHLGIELNHHEALSDAKGCAEIAIAAAKKNNCSVLELF